MPDRTDLLVVGAGPYAYSAAAFARETASRPASSATDGALAKTHAG